MLNRPFQRKGCKSNADVGKDFERKVHTFFKKGGLNLTPGIVIRIGINGKKDHVFDLGDSKNKVLVECKSHKWTNGGNVPSAKMMGWNEAMFLFYATSKNYRKIFCVLKDFSNDRKETLSEYYIKTNRHLIPKEVEIWEFDEKQGKAVRVH